MTLAGRLKQARELLEFTQAEISKSVDVSVQMWRSYEAGKSVPGGKVLESLARLGFNVNWLLTGVGPIKLHEEEIKRALCEEAHKELRSYVISKLIPYPAMFYDIPDLPYEQVQAYIKGELNLTKNQLIRLCEHVKRKFDSEKFIGTITSVDMSTFYPKKEPDRITVPLDIDVLTAILEEAEVYESVSPGTLTPRKKAQLIAELYEIRMGKTARSHEAEEDQAGP